MSRLKEDACLAALSALATSFTFKMREWTGISQSGEWPIGAAILLMIVWLVVKRKDGIRTTLLLASLIGIGTGITVASIAHRIETGRFLGPSLIFVFAPVLCVWLYIRTEKRERYDADEVVRFGQEFDAIKALPPDQVAGALATQMNRLRQYVDDAEIKERRFLRQASVLIALAILLVIVWFPKSIRPEPKPLMIVVDVTLLALGLSWFVMLAFIKRGKRRSPRTEAAD